MSPRCTSMFLLILSLGCSGVGPGGEGEGNGNGNGDGDGDGGGDGNGDADAGGLNPPEDAAPYGDGPVAITWSLQTPQGDVPSFTAWSGLHFDRVSGQILSYQTRATSANIYATDFYAYRTATQTWTRLGGTGSTGNSCDDGSASDVQPWPSDRHPISQMAIDTARDRLWLYGGVCQSIIQKSLWSYSLQADPTDNRMTRADVSDVYFHAGGRWPETDYMGALVYSRDDDVLFAFGYALVGGSANQNFVFCPTVAGALTPAQEAAGCTEADAWSVIHPATEPPLNWFPQLFYDGALRKVIHFGRNVSKGPETEIWAYDIPTQTWTDLRPTGLPAEPMHTNVETLMVHLTSGTGAGKFLYHQTSHGTGVDLAADFIFDPRTNTMSPLTSSGDGPTSLAYLTFDPSAGPNGTIVATEYGNRLWHGVLE